MHPSLDDPRQTCTPILRTDPASPPACQAAQAALDSQLLLRGSKAVVIRHNGEFYRLQATRQGKLILTK